MQNSELASYRRKLNDSAHAVLGSNWLVPSLKGCTPQHILGFLRSQGKKINTQNWRAKNRNTLLSFSGTHSHTLYKDQ
jgi:hypothetical protein